MINTIQKSQLAENSQLDTELTTLSFIKDYNPVVLIHTFSMFKSFDFEKCIAFLTDKSTVQYLLLAGINEISSLKEKFKKTVTLTNPSDAKLEIARLKKYLERSKNDLLSKSEELAKEDYVGNCHSLLSVYKFGFKNVANVLPFVSDKTIANAMFTHQESKTSLLSFLSEGRVKRIKQLQKNYVSSYTDRSEAINCIIKELNHYLLDPQSFGVDPFTFNLKPYQSRVIDFLYSYSTESLTNALEKTPINLIVNSLKILESFEQYGLLKLCSIEKAKYAFEQYYLNPTADEFSFKAFNKLVRLIQKISNEFKTAPGEEKQSRKRSAYTFDSLNNFDEKVWRQLVHEVSLKQIYLATCKAREHESMGAFMRFINKESIYIDYQQLDHNYDVAPHEVIDFQNDIIEECRRIQDMYDDVEFSALEAVIMEYHGVSQCSEINGKEEGNAQSSEQKQGFMDVYDHQELMEEVVLGLKESDSKIFQKIQDNGCRKRVVYVPRDYKQRLKILLSKYPNFNDVIKFIEGSFTESFLTNRMMDLPVINLDGEPGVGKSQFIIELSSMFGLSFNSLPVTSMGDKFELIGAHRTWNNASIGAFAKALLLEGDTYQPCFLIDELCLVKNKGERNLVPTLLSIFESEQSKSVTENFLGIEIDFSGILIFTTTNNLENLVPALRSRLVSFSVPKPSPEQMKLIGLNIYSSYLKEKNLDSFLSEKIPFTCYELFIIETPRKAKQVIIAAVRNALQRVDAKSKVSVSLEPSDFKQSANSIAPKTIGFVH
jgi:hypothetical protein